MTETMIKEKNTKTQYLHIYIFIVFLGWSFSLKVRYVIRNDAFILKVHFVLIAALLYLFLK